MGENGLQREMDAFLKETEDNNYNVRQVTKSAFSQARKNLSANAFLKLNDIIVQDFYKQVDFLGYKNHRILAVDGGFLNLPNHETIQEEFGIRKMGRGKIRSTQKSMCLLSLLYDPANFMTLDVQFDHMDGSELQLLLKHLSKVEKGDILLMDRGYPSRYDLIKLLAKKNMLQYLRNRTMAYKTVYTMRRDVFQAIADPTKRDIFGLVDAECSGRIL